MKENMKNGLVMEGGAMRGMFTCGVIDVFLENNIEFDGAIGVSAGATFGCNLKSKQAGRALRYNKRFCKDYRYGSFRSLLKTGDLYEARFCYREIPYKLDVFDRNTYRRNPMEFYVVATDMETGKPVYYKTMKGDKHDIDWIRASASMPLVSRVVELDGYKLLDGGISDSIPIRHFEEIGYERNVIITTRPADYVKAPTKSLKLCKLMLHKYPNFIETMANRHNAYNETVEYIKKREAEGAVFVIRPEESLGIGHMENNPDELERVYQIGRQVALKRLEDMKKFLEG